MKKQYQKKKRNNALVAYNKATAQKMKQFDNTIEHYVGEIYGCFAVVLASDKWNWDADAIGELFSDTYEVWNQSLADGLDMNDYLDEMGLGVLNESEKDNES